MESSDSEDPFSSDDEEADATWRPEGELSDIEDLNDYVMQVEKNVVIDSLDLITISPELKVLHWIRRPLSVIYGLF